jgi:hypothetical protein
MICKILKHGADGFTSPLKEGVLWTFIAIKNPLLSAGFDLMYSFSDYVAFKSF